MAVLLAHDPGQSAHTAGPLHPERPSRVDAVLAGVRAAGVWEAMIPFVPRAASRTELLRVHSETLLKSLEVLSLAGGGRLDPDTSAAKGSWGVALVAAGSGPAAIAALDEGEADAAFLAVRPPGHHALAGRAMGFCLLNNVAVAAALLADRGERVLVVDWDVHHGNGTQAIFYEDPRVTYVSLHQYPFYPGTGGLDEIGSGEGLGSTVNVPLPAGATGDAYRRAVDEIVIPVAERVKPGWVLVSAGFDAHRDDPLAQMALSAGDFADLADRIVPLAPPGRRLVFLEGGYDLPALAASAGACAASLVGVRRASEAPTSGGPGKEAVEAAGKAAWSAPRHRTDRDNP